MQSLQVCPCDSGQAFKNFRKGDYVHTMCEYCGTNDDVCGTVTYQGLNEVSLFSIKSPFLAVLLHRWQSMI